MLPLQRQPQLPACFAGIDVGSQFHKLAIVDDRGKLVGKVAKIDEDAEGYERLRKLLPPPEETQVGMEATGHYWRNLCLTLLEWGYSVAEITPSRTRRFADGEPGADQDRRRGCSGHRPLRP